MNAILIDEATILAKPAAGWAQPPYDGREATAARQPERLTQ
jgi:hypothetical protein